MVKMNMVILSGKDEKLMKVIASWAKDRIERRELKMLPVRMSSSFIVVIDDCPYTVNLEVTKIGDWANSTIELSN